MRPRIFFCLLLLAVSFDAAAGNLYTTINRLRAGDGICASAENLPPLQPQSVLERVARDLARGNRLPQSLEAAGYRAVRSSALSIKGDRVGAQAEAMLARQNACRQLQDGAMTEVGIYLDDRQLWIVLAAPFAPLAGVSDEAAERRILDLINQARATSRFAAAYTVLIGDELHSFVESVENVDEERIRAHLGKRLPFHSIPKTVRPLPNLPRNSNGKIDRAALEHSVAKGNLTWNCPIRTT